MKRIISFLTVLLLVLPHQAVFAAGKVAKFELTVSSTAKVGEALDLWVKVLGKDGEVVKDYAGTIYVTVDNDSSAKLPAADGYAFVAADQGMKTFSKGLSFTKEGTMTVSVIDIDDDKVDGSAKVTVTAAGGETVVTGKETVTLLSPDDGSMVAKGNLNVSGTTKKNSKVQVLLNGAKIGEVQSDDSGAFVYTIKSFPQEQNVISAQVLDGNDKAIGESKKVSVKIASDEGPAFKSLVVKEGTKDIKPNTILHISVEAAPKLKEVSVALGDSVEVLKETKEGVYEGTVTAPSKAGDAPIDATLTDDLGKKTLKASAAIITVMEVKAGFENIKIEGSPKRATFTFNVVGDSDAISKFKFDYGTGAELLDKSSTTFDKSKIAVVSTGTTASGSTATGSTYRWYIDGLTETKYFAKISALDAAGSVISMVTPSEVLEVNTGLNAASSCTIANISGVKVKKSADSSVISWDALADAAGYNIYKKDSSGKYVLIDNVKGNSYTIHLAEGNVKYDDFAIKAVCADKVAESKDYTEATKVQTGPGKVIALSILALVIAFAVVRRKSLLQGK